VTAAEREALIARAKQLAVPVANCTAAGIPPAHLIGDATWHELFALVLVLADAADHEALRQACAVSDDAGRERLEEERLRKAHAEAVRLRNAGLPVPLAVRAADSAYYAWRKAERAKAPPLFETDGTAA
jgi:hypothetical protein